MKPAWHAFVAMVLLSSSTFAGIVNFLPATITINEGENVNLEYSISIVSETDSWYAINILIGSDTVPINAQDFRNALPNAYCDPSCTGNDTNFYAYGITTWGLPEPGLHEYAVGQEVFFGALPVDTSILPVGEHQIVVNANRDDNQSWLFNNNTAEYEPLYGLATIVVVPVQDIPVPTVSQWGLLVMTLCLLTVGTLMITHRQGSAA